MNPYRTGDYGNGNRNANCRDSDRGKAGRLREDMKKNGENNKPKFVALSGSVHCKNGTLEDCPNYEKAREYLDSDDD